VAQFGLLIANTPESTIPGRMTTKGRIEYHFKVFGALTILFIEVKLEIGSADELHDAIAQVIAESDGKCASQRPCPISLRRRQPVTILIVDSISNHFVFMESYAMGSRLTFSPLMEARNRPRFLEVFSGTEAAL
jgi:hypothetical protein